MIYLRQIGGNTYISFPCFFLQVNTRKRRGPQLNVLLERDANGDLHLPTAKLNVDDERGPRDQIYDWFKPDFENLEFTRFEPLPWQATNGSEIDLPVLILTASRCTSQLHYSAMHFKGALSLNAPPLQCLYDLQEYLRLRFNARALDELLTTGEFTVTDLRRLWEQALGVQFDPSNFRHQHFLRMVQEGRVEPIDGARRPSTTRPAQLYRVRS